MNHKKLAKILPKNNALQRNSNKFFMTFWGEKLHPIAWSLNLDYPIHELSIAMSVQDLYHIHAKAYNMKKRIKANLGRYEIRICPI